MTHRNNVLRAEALRELLNYDPETGVLTWKPRGIRGWDARFAGRPALNCIHVSGYRSGTLRGITVTAHRAIFALVYGDLPEEIDHINGVRHDNRLTNLRGVTKAENHRNRKAVRNTSGVCGVHFSNQHQRWVAYITVDQVREYLGIYSEKSDATAARKAAEVRLGFHPNHGRFDQQERAHEAA